MKRIEKEVNPEVLKEAFIWLYYYENHGLKLAKQYVMPGRARDFYWDAVLRRIEYFSGWYDGSKHCEVKTAVYSFIDLAIRNEAWIGKEKFRRRKVRVVYGHDLSESSQCSVSNGNGLVEASDEADALWDKVTWAIHHASPSQMAPASMLFFGVPRAEWDCRLGVTRTRAAQVFKRFAEFVQELNESFPAPKNFRKRFRFETAFNKTKFDSLYKTCADCGKRFKCTTVNACRCSACQIERTLENQKKNGTYDRQTLDEESRNFIRSLGFWRFCQHCTSGTGAIRKAMEGKPVRKITFENVTRTIQNLKNGQAEKEGCGGIGRNANP